MRTRPFNFSQNITTTCMTWVLTMTCCHFHQPCEGAAHPPPSWQNIPPHRTPGGHFQVTLRPNDGRCHHLSG
jgi:hypothetical protein